MQGGMKRRAQMFLAGAIVLVAARTGYIFYQRGNDAKQAIEQEKQKQLQKDTLDADYYVSLPKLYAYDLKGAQDIAKSPVWVRVGYGTYFYPFDPATKHANFAHEAGLLQPLEKLQITKVVLDRPPKVQDQLQIMAVYGRDGKTYAFPIGAQQGSNFSLYANDMLFMDDPHKLYKHWPPEVWDAIDKHEVRPGMNELQAACSVGLGLLEGSGTGSERVLHYANGGSPLTVTFHNGKAAEIQKGS